MAEAKRLADPRSGRLPPIGTRKLLAGGETCHWDSPCRHTYRTGKGLVHVEGDLAATSKRVIFVSPTRNCSFAPWKIVDTEGRGHRVALEVEARQGSGENHVDGPKDLEAILLPGDVKRAVWARDGGRCVVGLARQIGRRLKVPGRGWDAGHIEGAAALIVTVDTSGWPGFWARPASWTPGSRATPLSFHDDHRPDDPSALSRLSTG